jgi:hypothetical protein
MKQKAHDKPEIPGLKPLFDFCWLLSGGLKATLPGLKVRGFHPEPNPKIENEKWRAEARPYV